MRDIEQESTHNLRFEIYTGTCSISYNTVLWHFIDQKRHSKFGALNKAALHISKTIRDREKRIAEFERASPKYIENIHNSISLKMVY